jgi:hypothetical protein
MKHIGLAFLLLAGFTLVAAPRKSAQPENTQDTIAVVGHISLAKDGVVNLMTGAHWNRNYLYVEHGDQGAVTVVDVTDPSSPKRTAEFVPPYHGVAQHMTVVEGSAALFVSTQSAKAEAAPARVAIMSFADPEHPKMVREFSGVTCMLRGDRGITYLVNGEGLWVLQPAPARDRQADDEYFHQLLYNH